MSFIQFRKTPCNWPTCIIAFSALVSTLKYRTNQSWQSWFIAHQQDSSVAGKDRRIMVYKDHPFKNCEIKPENSALQFANCYFPWNCWADNFTKESPDHIHKPRNKERSLYDRGFSFFSLNNARSDTPDTFTTLNRTPGISPTAWPFRPNPAIKTSSCKTTHLLINTEVWACVNRKQPS